MSFESLTSKSTTDPVILVEIFPKIEIEGFSWTRYGSEPVFYASWDLVKMGVIINVEENGASYTETLSLSSCISTVSSYYFDTTNLLLYVHTSTGESPSVMSDSVYKFCILAQVGFGFCQSGEAKPLVFSIAGSSYNYPYLTYLKRDGISDISESMGDFFIGNLEYGEADLEFVNDGWFFDFERNFLWAGVPAVIKVGNSSDNYSEFENVFCGVISSLSISQEDTKISLTDLRGFYFSKTVPVSKFLASDYEYMEYEKINTPIPLAFGRCRNVMPVCIDRVNFKYKITNYKIKSILAVYKSDLILQEGIDYSVDLENAEFTLLSDPGSEPITVDVEGIQVGETENSYYEDRDYTDEAHADQHNDTDHSDSPHADSHGDTSHSDIPHEDEPYVDEHWDHYDGGPPYEDAHFDDPHQDVTHQDVPSHSDYSDVSHLDTPHYDSYSDTDHADLAHLDGYYSDYYSENAADIAKWIMKNLLSISESQIDNDAFDDLRTNRTQKMSLFVSTEQPVAEIFRILQTSALFHLVALPSGVWTVKRFSNTGDIEVFDKSNIISWSLSHILSNLSFGISLGFDKDWTLGSYRYVSVTDGKVFYRFGNLTVTLLESALYDDTEALTLAQVFLSMLKAPRKEIEMSLDNTGLRLSLADRVGLDLDYENQLGENFVPFESEIYRVTSITKNLNSGEASVKLISEPPLAGGFHSDAPHSDFYTDIYSDSPHTDVAHSDILHIDEPHADVEHADVEHSDIAHGDRTHDDYLDHLDGYYGDRYSDTHIDRPYSDTVHEDVPHEDSHGDSHADTAHQDIPYLDSHTDTHGDTIHSDSYY